MDGLLGTGAWTAPERSFKHGVQDFVFDLLPAVKQRETDIEVASSWDLDIRDSSIASFQGTGIRAVTFGFARICALIKASSQEGIKLCLNQCLHDLFDLSQYLDMDFLPKTILKLTFTLMETGCKMTFEVELYHGYELPFSRCYVG